MLAGISFHRNPDTVHSTISDVTPICHSMVEHLQSEETQSPNFNQIHPHAIERLRSKSRDWLERLVSYGCDRFNDVAPSYGIEGSLVIQSFAVA